MSNSAPAQFVAQGAGPDPGPGQAPAQAPTPAQAQAAPRQNVPFNHIDGRLILPPNERHCRIARTSLTSATGWELCQRDELFTKRGLKEHINTPGQYHWKRGDDIHLATPALLKLAAANLASGVGGPPQPFILARTNDDILPERRGSKSSRAGSASAQGGLQRNPPAPAPAPRPQDSAAAPPVVPAQGSPAGQLPLQGQAPPPGVNVRGSYEYNGRWYIQHEDNMWYDHGSST